MASGLILTLFGTRGGIGKTVLATNLAVAIAQETGRRVALADLHLRFGDVAILLDLPVGRSITDLALSEHELNADALRSCLYTYSTRVSVLPAPIRPTNWRDISAEHVERIVSLLSETHDYVVLDTGPPFNEIVASALKGADSTLLITTEDETTLNDTRLAIDMLRSWRFPSEKIRLVVNSTNADAQVQPQEIERLLGMDVLCSVPYDRNIFRATQLGLPLVVSHPGSAASKSFVWLARNLAPPSDVLPLPKRVQPRVGQRSQAAADARPKVTNARAAHAQAQSKKNVSLAQPSDVLSRPKPPQVRAADHSHGLPRASGVPPASSSAQAQEQYENSANAKAGGRGTVGATTPGGWWGASSR